MLQTEFDLKFYENIFEILKLYFAKYYRGTINLYMTKL